MAECEVFLPAGKPIGDATSRHRHYPETWEENFYATVRCFSASNSRVKQAHFSGYLSHAVLFR